MSIKNNIGVLLPVSALPSRNGIGDFGLSSTKFLDWLSKHHYRYWQILPLNPIGSGNSPYMSVCSKAIDYRYISLDSLVEEGLLKEVPDYLAKSPRVNYEKVGEFKFKYLQKAYKAYRKTDMNGLKKFKTKNPWVGEYATFVVFKKLNNGDKWINWNEEQLHYYKKHNNPPKTLIKDIDFICFMQFIAYKEWKHVMAYAKMRNVKIIADMPFYVDYDSVDCWLHPEQFKFDENQRQTEVGGVPPDYFSEEGQLWGSPIYDFDYMKKDNYRFLIDRTSYLNSLCDILRIDHFRAFDTYYVIPATSKTAKIGEWKIGPRTDFFDELYKTHPECSLVAEDLGDLFPSVYELRDHYQLPGMFVTQFLICDYKFWPNENLILYTGTHDNETFYSWFKSLDDKSLDIIRDRIQSKSDDLYTDLMAAIYNMPSKITIFPLQDLLKLTNSARFNTPSTSNNLNWTWRLNDWSWMDKIKFFYK